jgi:hypothetical protein
MSRALRQLAWLDDWPFPGAELWLCPFVIDAELTKHTLCGVHEDSIDDPLASLPKFNKLCGLVAALRHLVAVPHSFLLRLGVEQG